MNVREIGRWQVWFEVTKHYACFSFLVHASGGMNYCWIFSYGVLVSTSYGCTRDVYGSSFDDCVPCFESTPQLHGSKVCRGENWMGYDGELWGLGCLAVK